MTRDEAFACLASVAGKGDSLEEDPDLLRRLEAEKDLYDAALAWFLENDEVGPGFRLASELHVFWMKHGHLTEGREWLHRLLEAGGSPSDEERVKGLTAAGRLAFRQGDNEIARALLDEAIELARAGGSREGEARALAFLSRVSLRDHDFAKVRELAQASVDIFHELGDPEGEWSPLHVLAYVTMMEGDLPRAKELFLGSVELARSIGKEDEVGGEFQNLGVIETRLGNLDAAVENYAVGLGVAVKNHDTYLLPYIYLGLGAVATLRGDAERGARLIGLTDAALEETGMVLDPGDQPDYDDTVRRAQGILGADDFEAARQAGKRLSYEAGIELAHSYL